MFDKTAQASIYLLARMEQRVKTTQDRILEAAFELFSARGVDLATTREIARAADVNEVTIFRHFRNKDGLVQAVIERYLPTMALPRLNRLQLGDGWYEALLELTGGILALHREREDFFRFCFSNIIQHPEQREFFRNVQTPVIGWLTELFAPFCRRVDFDPELMALEFMGPIVMRSVRRVFLGEALLDEARFAQAHARLFADMLAGMEARVFGKAPA